MGFLDIRTMVLGQFLSGAICALVMGGLWRYGRRRYDGLFFLFLTFALQLVWVGGILLRGVLPDALSIVAANTLGMGSFIFLHAGLGAFFGKPGFSRANWVMLAAFSVVVFYFGIISPDLPARNLNLSLFVTLFCGRCAWLLMREIPEEFRGISRPAAYALLGFSLVSVLRIVILFAGRPAHDFLRDATPDNLVLLFYPALTTLLTFTLFLMVTRRLLADTAADFDRRLEAEKKLDKTEKSFRDLFENMGEGFALHEMIFDAAGRAADYRFLSANRSFETLTGLRAADIIGHTALEVIPGLDMDFVRIYGEVVRSGVPVVLERRAEALGKDYRISVYRPFPGQFATVFSDITAVKAAEAELRASEERFQKAFHAAPFLMSLSEIATGRYIEVNDRFCEVSGFSREELIGRTSTEVGWISSELRDKLRLSSNGVSLRIPEVTLTAKGGRRVVCSYSFERLPLSGKNIMVGVGEDLTDRKKAEEALKSSEEQFRRVVDKAPDAIFIQSGGKFLYMNSASAQLFGAASGEEMVGRDLMEFLVPKYRPIVLERIRKQMETSESVPALEEEYFRLDGSTVMVEVTAVPVLFEAKSSHMVFMRDIGARKRAEAAMQAAQKLESLGVLAGGIAHDFNNLLTGITGNLSLIRTAGDSCGEVPDLVKEAEAACFTAKGLARQLLTFASGGEPVKIALDLAGLVRESVAFSLRGSPVKGEVDAGPEPICVMADKDQLFQVVNNLVMNAAQAMGGRGVVKVSVSREELRAGDGPAIDPGAYARFDVSDSGPGIPADMIGKLFDPYFSTKGKGRGLGLAVCRSIVLKHGGHIGVESEPGKGSVFTIYLPWAECGEAVSGARAAQPLPKGRGRVLIMDDEEVVYKALKRMLTSLGYEAEVAVNGEKALEAWQAARAAGRPFAAVIMDLTISGGMGGAEAVKRLKELDPSAKAIVSSGYADDPIMADYGAHGFLGVLSKPYQVEDLASIMRKVLG